MNGAQLLVAALVNEGVDRIFGLPGEENLVFLEALRTSPIELVLTRHEQAAGFMAATYGRLTGRPGVCLSTLGPGATNLVTSVAHALLGGMPSLFITGQKPIKKSKQGRFQIIDVVGMLRPVTKMTRQIVGAASIPALVREACRVAVQEKPGPVHLELPEDIAAEEAEAALFLRTPEAHPQAAQGAIEQAAQVLAAARNPLLLIAAAAKRPGMREALTACIDRTGLHFFSTQMGKGGVDEYHPLCLGTAALSEHDYLHCAIDHADVIVNVGHDIVEKPPFHMRRPGPVVIHLHSLPAAIDEVYFPQYEVVGEPADSLRRLSLLLNPGSLGGDGYFQRMRRELEEHVYAVTARPGLPPTPQQVVAVCRDVLPDKSILTLDNGMYKIWFARNYKARHANSVLLDNALATMGAGLPMAIAAKILEPQRPVVAVCGDGGFLMNSQEMETAVRLGLDLTVVVLRDNGFGMIRWKQDGMGLPHYGLEFGNPDFVAYAASYGAIGLRAGSTEDFALLLARCLQTPGVKLIELPVDYSENERVLIEELRRKTCIL
ncbi:MAG: acetolactate synthase large subunit [Desulfobulbaceae bacterium A2]|nr:MAG: acetolactate synthase large subunit [Desulfobulbaceae bacterium A2]